jgi:addiction module RelB/DinJ family antitoxin
MDAVLNFKTDKKLKTEAQKVAKDLGLPLGTIMNNYLKRLVQERTVVFEDLQVNEKTLLQLRKASADAKKGINLSPRFDNVDDAIAWLDS